MSDSIDISADIEVARPREVELGEGERARLRLVDEIYCDALDLDGQAREAYLQERCGDDANLRAEVEDLISGAEESFDEVDGAFAMLRDTYWHSLVDEDAVEDLSGQRVGIWQITSVAGRGGLATVYEAERDDGEFRQRAALKVMRRGLDTDDLIQRFRAEREILATLQHPAIAGILDGGAMPDGRPYFVMEFVDGKVITDYVKSKDLGVDDRVRLIRQVAEGVHHAHQNLIVHRDIKPSNVMVDENRAVRILDFGIAKVLDTSEAPLASQLTRTGIKMMTPAYASPEQERGEHITTNTDVYQLGLLLAEVLTGDPPVRSDYGVATPYIKNIAEPDLLAIIQKATRLEPEGRYESVLDLAADLERYIERLPVLARRDSVLYRLGKYVRRRPWVAPVAAVSVLAVVGYITTITLYSQEVERERAIAEQTRDFLIGLFQSPNPMQPADPERGRRITVLEALQIGSERGFAGLEDQPELKSALSRSLSAVYAALDQYEPAIALREQALSLEQEIYGADSSHALASMRAIAALARRSGDLQAASELTERQLELASKLPSPGIEVGLALQEAGTQAVAEGAEDDAIGHLNEAIEELVTKGGIGAQLGSDEVQSILQTASDEGTGAGVLQAEKLVLKVLGEDSEAGLQARLRSANSLKRLGEYEAAESRFLTLIPALENHFGARHPTTLAARSDLANLYIGTERYAESEALYEALLPVNVEVFGLDSQAVAINFQNLGTAIARQGRSEDALVQFGRAQTLFREIHGADHYLNALPRLSSAYLYLMSADERALPAAEEAVAILDKAQPDSYMLGIARCLAGKAMDLVGNAGGETMLASAQPLLQDERVSGIYADLCRAVDD